MILLSLLLAPLVSWSAPPPAASDLADAGGPYTVAAEGSVRFDAGGSSVGACSRVTYEWDVGGDGTIDLGPSAASDSTWTAEGIDGPWTVDLVLYVNCTVGGSVSYVGKAGTTLTVENVGPVIEALEVEASIREGVETAFSLGFSDVEAADTHTVSWDLGDGVLRTGSSVSRTYQQDGEYTVTVAVADDDGGRDSWVQRVTVDNVAPQIDGDPATTAWVDEIYRFEPAVVDLGVLDVHVWTAELPAGASLDRDTGAISWVPGSQDGGEHTLSLTVHDDAGGSDSLLWTVQVEGGNDGGASDGGSSDGGSSDGGDGDRPWGDGTADPDPWDDAWPISGEGCRCGAGGTALLLPGLLPLMALRRRRVR